MPPARRRRLHTRSARATPSTTEHFPAQCVQSHPLPAASARHCTGAARLGRVLVHGRGAAGGLPLGRCRGSAWPHHSPGFHRRWRLRHADHLGPPLCAHPSTPTFRQEARNYRQQPNGVGQKVRPWALRHFRRDRRRRFGSLILILARGEQATMSTDEGVGGDHRPRCQRPWVGARPARDGAMMIEVTRDHDADDDQRHDRDAVFAEQRMAATRS